MSENMAILRSFIVLILVNLAIDRVNTESLGYTSPPTDIFLLLGNQSLDIYCTVTNENVLRKHPQPSRYLKFGEDDRFDNYTKILNETTALLHIDADVLKLGKFYYICLLNLPNRHGIVGRNLVTVGMSPSGISDFKCISLNNDNLTCTWTKPNYGFDTYFNLSFTVLGTETSCPKIAYDQAGIHYSCFWSTSTEPSYRQSAEFFLFKLTTSVKSGVTKYSHSQFLDFDHYANVIPNAPIQLTVVNSTTNSLFLNWIISPTIRTLHGGLEYRVMYLCKLGMGKEKKWKLAAIDDVQHEDKDVHFNLTGIPYAHNLCDIRVALKAKKANDESMWSRNATIDAHYTSSTVPGTGPKLNMGSYMYINESSIRIYWQKVPIEKENGANLQYNITLVRGGNDVIVGEIKSNSAVVRNLTSTKNYTFAVWAYNDVGENAERAYITIPARKYSPFKVHSLTKIESTINSIDISWTKGSDARVKNYTIFWCTDTQTNKENCNGDWNWTYVPHYQSKFQRKFDYDTNLIKSVHYHFAIAANSETVSSGMMFTTCDKTGVTDGSVPTVILKQPTVYEDTWVKLVWDVGCATEGIERFEIDYCQLVSDECSTKAMQLNISGYKSEFVVDELKAYKTYRFTIVAIKENNNRGVLSDPVKVTTSEGPPSEPRDLNATDVSNSSITLTWKRPMILNGVIRDYRIIYNGVEIRTNSSEEMTYTLTKLFSFQMYDLNVSACTTVCGNANRITLKTLMGYPSKIEQPKALDLITPDSEITIVWPEPAERNGPLDFYQVEVNDRIIPETTKERRYLYECDKKMNSYKIRVRAWNIDTHQNYSGKWSDHFQGNCKPPTQWLIPTLVLLLIFISGLAVFGKKLYGRCRKMQDVEVKLPSDLVNSTWPIPKESSDRESKSSSKTAADEELLLKTRFNDSNKQNCDSSGCSSAHGSVASDTDTTISATSDSGTEQGELRKRSRVLLINPKTESYSRVGIEANPLENPDEVSVGYTRMPSTFGEHVEPQSISMTIEPTSYPYVSYETAMNKPPQKEEPFSKPYVQIADANLIKNVVENKQRDDHSDGRLSYVSVGQNPNMKSIKED